MKRFVFILLFGFLSCTSERKEVTERVTKVSELINDTLIVKLYNADSALRVLDLFPIDTLNSGIKVDLRYAGENNFMGKILYDTLNRAYLQLEVLERLYQCQGLLDSLHPGYHLLVYDAVRPLNVQTEMWYAMDSVPAAIRGRYVSNPKSGSVHNFGCAVDLTICDEKGDPIDMGAGYDDFRNIAFPSMEKEFIQSGELNKAQYTNRVLLRKVMRSQRFYNIPSEWWHFNAFTRAYCIKNFAQLLTESGDFRKIELVDTSEVSLPKAKTVGDTTGNKIPGSE